MDKEVMVKFNGGREGRFETILKFLRYGGIERWV